MIRCRVVIDLNLRQQREHCAPNALPVTALIGLRASAELDRPRSPSRNRLSRYASRTVKFLPLSMVVHAEDAALLVHRH
jgi:hypothetical protein